MIFGLRLAEEWHNGIIRRLMNRNLPRLTPARKTGDEPFRLQAAPIESTLIDFWRWSMSDLVNNTMRGVLAEYIVATALGIPTDGTREAWASHDLKTPGGLKIEVKSAAYVQSWFQLRLSTIQFKVTKRKPWDADTGEMQTEKTRFSHIYVFAVLAHRNKESINPLDLDQWEFYVLPTQALDRRIRSQHSITLPSLNSLTKPVSFIHLKDTVEQIIREHGLPTLR